MESATGDELHEMKRGGDVAKGKYHEWLERDGLIKLEAWARDGLIDEQIASNIGITRQTLTEWKKQFPAISDALKKGKEVVDFEVENALLKRAIGYEYEEIKEEYGPGGVLCCKVVMKKHMPPDLGAQVFWLKNRKPLDWRDKREVVTEKAVEDLTPIAEMLK